MQRVIEQLPDWRMAGFYTREIRQEGHRVGFEAMGLGGKSTVLAHVDFQSKFRVADAECG